jgi:hypothetical protein
VWCGTATRNRHLAKARPRLRPTGIVELKYRGVKVLRVESQPPQAVRARAISPAPCRARGEDRLGNGGLRGDGYCRPRLALRVLRLRRRLIPWDDETA